MKVFIWERVNDLTDSWHTDGGLVVIAPDLASARESARGQVKDECEAFTEDPDMTVDAADGTTPAVFVFPDAGCC